MAVDGSAPPVIDVGLDRLAAGLGLSLAVVRSALRRLIEDGIVERHQPRAGTRRFATVRYRVVGVTGLLSVWGGVEEREPGACGPYSAEPDAAGTSVASPCRGRPHTAGCIAGPADVALARPTRRHAARTDDAAVPHGSRPDAAASSRPELQLSLLDADPAPPDTNPATT